MNHYLFMGFNLATALLIAAAVLFVVLILVSLGAFIHRRRARTLSLRNRFGWEYECAILQFGTAHGAEANPADPESQCEPLMIRELGVTERDRFVTEWHIVQSRFAHHPRTALIEADDLIDALLEARGYPQAGFERRAADVAVDYPRAMEKYRLAHPIAVRLGQVEATNEELRSAMAQYREIFDDLLQTPRRVETEPPRSSKLATRPFVAPYFGARAR